MQGYNNLPLVCKRSQHCRHAMDNRLCKITKAFINSLLNDKIFYSSKLKAFAGSKINGNKKLKFGLGRVESIVGKGENAVYKHFLLFPQYFQKPYVSEPL